MAAPQEPNGPERQSAPDSAVAGGSPGAEDAVVSHLRERFPDALLGEVYYRGEREVGISRERIPAVAEFLRDEPGLEFDFLMDLCAVDYLGRREPRFDVVYHFYSLRHNHRLRVCVPVGEASAEVPSLTGLWKAADWFEREVWDLYGIRFSGHPDLRRLLLYNEFKGHPLRKDYRMKDRQPLIGPGSKGRRGAEPAAPGSQKP